jgi:hypothetical protein
MFGILRQQVFTAAPKQCLPVAGHIHSVHDAPYTGRLGYETVARRFSAESDPVAFFARKRRQKSLERGQYVEVHDIGMDSHDYDVLMTDVKHETLETTIIEELGIGYRYLSKPHQTDVDKVVLDDDGHTHGQIYGPIIPLVVTNLNKSHRVFIIDSEAPLTCLSAQVSASYCIRQAPSC